MFGRGISRRRSRRMMRRSIVGLVIGGAALLALGSFAYRSRQRRMGNVQGIGTPMP